MVGRSTAGEGSRAEGRRRRRGPRRAGLAAVATALLAAVLSGPASDGDEVRIVLTRTTSTGALVVETRSVPADRLTATLADLRARPDVGSVEVEVVYETAAPAPTDDPQPPEPGPTSMLPRATPGTGDPLRPQQWQYDRLAFEQAADRLVGAAPITVAVVDSGVDGTHPDLATVVLRGCNKIRPAFAGETPPPDPTGPPDASGCYGRTATFGEGDARTDVLGHGTFVSSLLAAPENGVGITGAAPNVAILPVKVLDENNRARAGDIAAGIVWAVDNGARVINVSVSMCGTPTRTPPCDATRSQAIADAVSYARSRDVLIVASSGNRGSTPGVTVWPAAEPGVLAVTSVATDDSKSTFANDGWFIGLAAPGELLIGALSQQTAAARQWGALHHVRSGTSFAAPLVAATAAMVRSVAPGLSAQQTLNVVLRTALPLGYRCPTLPPPDSPTAPPPTGPCNAQFGYGLVDPLAAVDLARLSQFEPVVTSITAATAGETRESVTVTGRNLDHVRGVGISGGVEVRSIGSRTPTTLVVEVNPLGAVPGVSGAVLLWAGGVVRCGACVEIRGTAAAPATTAPGAFAPRTPVRLVDTRLTGGRITADSARLVRVDPAVAAPGEVLALNVTVTDAAGGGHVTVFPVGTTRPATSNVNAAAGGTVANAAVVPLGADGLAVYSSTSAHVVVDLVGTWRPTPDARAGRLVASAPRRLVDTRTAGAAPLAGGTSRTIPLAAAGVPADAAAVAVTVTATGATGTGFVTTWGDGTRPTTSTLNVAAGDTVANTAIVRVARDAGGRPFVTVHASTTTHLVVDLVGWFTGASAPAATSGLLVAATGSRVLDTRPAGAAVVAGATLPFRDPRAVDATSLVANVTLVDGARAGYGSVWAAGLPWPGTSTVNVSAPGQTRAALALTAVGNGGDANVLSSLPAHVVVDVAGWFTR